MKNKIFNLQILLLLYYLASCTNQQIPLENTVWIGQVTRPNRITNGLIDTTAGLSKENVTIHFLSDSTFTYNVGYPDKTNYQYHIEGNRLILEYTFNINNDTLTIKELTSSTFSFFNQYNYTYNLTTLKQETKLDINQVNQLLANQRFVLESSETDKDTIDFFAEPNCYLLIDSTISKYSNFNKWFISNAADACLLMTYGELVDKKIWIQQIQGTTLIGVFYKNGESYPFKLKQIPPTFSNKNFTLSSIMGQWEADSTLVANPPIFIWGKNVSENELRPRYIIKKDGSFSIHELGKTYKGKWVLNNSNTIILFYNDSGYFSIGQLFNHNNKTCIFISGGNVDGVSDIYLKNK